MSRSTLNELMGKRGTDFKEQGISFDDLPDLLGDSMPKLEFHALGRVRLVKALRNRFGSNFRNVPGVSQLMGKFDEAAKKEVGYAKITMRLGRK